MESQEEMGKIAGGLVVMSKNVTRLESFVGQITDNLKKIAEASDTISEDVVKRRIADHRRGKVGGGGALGRTDNQSREGGDGPGRTRFGVADPNATGPDLGDAVDGFQRTTATLLEGATVTAQIDTATLNTSFDRIVQSNKDLAKEIKKLARRFRDGKSRGEVETEVEVETSARKKKKRTG